MKNLIKPLFSILAITCFMAIAFSCQDEQQYYTECNYLNPPVTKNHEILIRVKDKTTNSPISNVTVRVYYYKYKMIDSDPVKNECYIQLEDSSVRTQNTGDEGIAYIVLDKKYVSNKDKINITVQTEKDGYYSDNESFTFNVNEQNFGKTIYLLKYNKYP